MKVKELIALIPDKIIIYKQVSENMDFTDLYKGNSRNIPNNVANMKIRIVGAARKGIVEIQVN